MRDERVTNLMQSAQIMKRMTKKEMSARYRHVELVCCRARNRFYYFIMHDGIWEKGQALDSNRVLLAFGLCHTQKREINKFFICFSIVSLKYAGPPETHFIEDVRKERIELGRLARELSQDAELLQVGRDYGNLG